MLRALYAYKGTHARTLGFVVGEKFLEIGTSRDPNWMHVISERGSLGYVPKNYMAVDEIPAIDMLEFIDGCIEATHLNSSEKGGTYSKSEQEALQSLVQLRQDWLAKIPANEIHPSKRPAPPPPQVFLLNRTSSQLSGESCSLYFMSQAGTPDTAPGTPRAPCLSTSASCASLVSSSSFGPIGREATPVESCTSFMARGESLVREESSSSSSNEGQTLSNGKEPVQKNDKDFSSIVLQNSNVSLVSQVPANYLRILVEEVRSQTNISFATSHQVVQLVLCSLGNTFPTLETLSSHILATNDQKNGGEVILGQASEWWQQSADGRRLVQLLEKLRECKDDEQQRSWALHEDEHIIASHINELLDLLNNGDLAVCRKVLSLEDFRPILTLVQYYQMETRWTLRKLMLQVFGSICQMSAANISYLTSSVLPVELTRDMIENQNDVERVQYLALVLGMMLCMGDTLPYPHFFVMNEEFVDVLVNGIEVYNEDPDSEQLAELYLTLLLAFNLQYLTHLPIIHPVAQCTSIHDTNQIKETNLKTKETVIENSIELENQSESMNGSLSLNSVSPFRKDVDNLIIKLLSIKKCAKHFTEKLLLLFNREDDPLAMFDHEPRPQHSVLKMMRDMYSTSSSASLVYTNDEMVVCDIIIRQLKDLTTDDKRRSEYLHLAEGVIVTGAWQEHQHRQKELLTCLRNILLEDEVHEPQDHLIIRRIMKCCPEFCKD